MWSIFVVTIKLTDRRTDRQTDIYNNWEYERQADGEKTKGQSEINSKMKVLDKHTDRERNRISWRNKQKLKNSPLKPDLRFAKL
jgi:hypothetical protein